jgi:hypothetical protein
VVSHLRTSAGKLCSRPTSSPTVHLNSSHTRATKPGPQVRHRPSSTYQLLRDVQQDDVLHTVAAKRQYLTFGWGLQNPLTDRPSTATLCRQTNSFVDDGVALATPIPDDITAQQTAATTTAARAPRGRSGGRGLTRGLGSGSSRTCLSGRQIAMPVGVDTDAHPRFPQAVRMTSTSRLRARRPASRPPRAPTSQATRNRRETMPGTAQRSSRGVAWQATPLGGEGGGPVTTTESSPPTTDDQR